ncbi:MAG: C39 family peptidase, partial [Alphaproteobacteria bacterium]
MEAGLEAWTPARRRNTHGHARAIAWRAFALAGLLAFAAAETASGQIITMPFGGTINPQRKSMVDLRFVNVVRQRFDLSCGAAAVATLLSHFYGDVVDEKAVIEDALKTGDKEKIEKDGFSMLELKRYGDRRGYAVQGFKITKPDAITEIKIPFLTLINSRGYDHFVIVKGTKDGIVYIADPAFGNRSRPLAEFKAEWSQVI